MTQLASAVSLRDCVVEVSTNGTTWTVISGATASVEVSGGDRQTGEVYTFAGDTALLTVGKREPIEVTVKIVYSEGTSEAFEIVRAAYEAGTALFVRWSPRGGLSGQARYTSTEGRVTSFGYPAGEVGAGPILTEFTVRVTSITRSLIA